MSEQPILSLRGLSKSYTGKTGGVTHVLDGIDLDVRDGEFIAILGFSGAGKTTLISAIAGLIEADSRAVGAADAIFHPGQAVDEEVGCRASADADDAAVSDKFEGGLGGGAF